MKVLKDNWFIIILLAISISVVLLFVDFSFLHNNTVSRDVNIYKIYKLYDEASTPVTLTYDVLEIKKSSSIDKTISTLFEALKMSLPANTTLISQTISDDVLTLNLNQAFLDNHIVNNKKQKILNDCVINTLTQVKGINKIQFIVNGQKIDDDNIKLSYNQIFISNINEYIIYSKLKNNMTTYLYKDLNYQLVYNDDLNEYQKIELLDTKKNISKYLIVSTKDLKITNRNETWEVKDDGLYVDNSLILPSTYKVGDYWEAKKYQPLSYDKTYQANFIIKSISLQPDNSLLVVIECQIPKLKKVTDSIEQIYKETITLKQGIGLYEKIINDPNHGNIKYSFKERKFKDMDRRK